MLWSIVMNFFPLLFITLLCVAQFAIPSDEHSNGKTNTAPSKTISFLNLTTYLICKKGFKHIVWNIYFINMQKTKQNKNKTKNKKVCSDYYNLITTYPCYSSLIVRRGFRGNQDSNGNTTKQNPWMTTWQRIFDMRNTNMKRTENKSNLANPDFSGLGIMARWSGRVSFL